MGHALKALPVVAAEEPTLAGIELRLAEIVGVPVSTLHKWREEYPLFGEPFDEIVGAVKAREGAKLAVRGLSKAVDVHIKTIEGKQKSQLRFDAAYKLEKGFGVLTEKTETEVKGIVGIFNADDLAREYRETKKRLAEAGNEPLGVPGRASKDK